MINRSTIYAALAAMALMLVSFFMGWTVRGNRLAPAPAQDTIVVTRVDTVTLVGARDTLIRTVWRPYPVAVHDTTTIVRHVTDSVLIALPYEHRHWSNPDTLDIWYSGVDPRVDSARVYRTHTVEIINRPVVDYRMPALTLDMGAGTGIVHNEAPNWKPVLDLQPYALTKLSLNRPSTTFSAYGLVDIKGRWAAGLNVTYRIDIVK